MSKSDILTPVQVRAIHALLTERTTRDAAKVVHVAERTLWRWLEDDTFRAELVKQEGALLEQVTRGLLTMQDTALKELGELITGFGGNVSAAVRLQAVRTALEIHLRYRELYVLEERIRKLEEAQNVTR